MGGSGAGPYRKIGWPVLIAIYGFSIHAMWWQVILAVGLSVFAVTRPFTYHEDSLHEHWFNWMWVWIMGIILGLPMLAYGHFNLWPFAWCLAATLSNIKSTARIFVWEFCECICGITVML